MNAILKLEELAMLGLSIFLFSFLPYQWWWFLALFLAPDIGMIGYVINNRVGAMSYNLFHHKGVAIAIYLAGIHFEMPELQLAGLILFGHASFDRALGYGLKHSDSFKNTHLGRL